MKRTNIEIKAVCKNHQTLRNTLIANHADFKGTDHQVDTYFTTTGGRLKLREGTIENHLIFYERKDSLGPKQSDVTLYASDPHSSLKEILINALGVRMVVDKQREIYFIDNVKFHLDTVLNLGTFVEIEAIDFDGTVGTEKLREQCAIYMNLCDIREQDLLSVSYADLMNKGK